jgi:hypothetical protein
VSVLALGLQNGPGRRASLGWDERNFLSLPNVFYEVGYAHALGKPVIHLTQDPKDIPFDLKHYPHIVYGKKISALIPQLEKQLAHRLSSGSSITYTPASNLRFHWRGQLLPDDAHLAIAERSLPTRFISIILDVHNEIGRGLDICEFKAGLLCSPRFESCRGQVWGADNKTLRLHMIQQPDSQALFLLPGRIVLDPDEWTTLLFQPFAITPGMNACEIEKFALRLFTSAGTSSLRFTAALEAMDADTVI